eukprot:Em0020g384a
MTNSTNHNLKGDDMVSAALETEHIPSHQVHPLSMFTRCLQDLFKQINITISPTKVFAVSLSEEGFNNCLYHSLLEPTVEVIEKCCGEILELLLPILANSWKQQDV